MSLKNGDLKGVITPYISIDEFEPKSGTTQEVIVVGFYAADEEPGKDLNTFIQRGSFDVLDTEVSPNPDEEGRYVVFVEFDRNKMFPESFLKFIKDIENLTDKQEWQVKPYLADNAMRLNDPELFNRVILSPEEYKPKDELEVDDIEAEIEECLKNSMITNVLFEGKHVVFDNKIAANIIAFGNSDKMSIMLRESAISFEEKTEVTALSKMLGETWNVHNLTDKVAIENTQGEILLVDDIQFVYGL